MDRAGAAASFAAGLNDLKAVFRFPIPLPFQRRQFRFLLAFQKRSPRKVRFSQPFGYQFRFRWSTFE